MSNRLLLICITLLSGCLKRVDNESRLRNDVCSQEDTIKYHGIVPVLDTTSTINDKDSERSFLGEPCFTVSPKEVGNTIDSLIKAFNGLRCIEGDSNIVLVEFLVDSTGKASSFKIAKSLCPRLNKTALKIVSSAKFEPGRCGKQKTQMRMTYLLNFSQTF